jgi:RNA polymerase sigma-70 factor, ECF subfamily
VELAGVPDQFEDADEAELVAHCRAGDQTAWQLFFDRHFLYVVRSARRLGTPPDEAEDVAQEVFALAFRKFDQLQEGKASSWLYRFCANVVSAHHRRRRVRQAWAFLFREKHEDRTPETELEESDAQRAVGRILERMSPRKREVLVLFEIEQLSGEEIAERLGCRLETVWSRLFYARQQFNQIGRRLHILDGQADP